MINAKYISSLSPQTAASYGATQKMKSDILPSMKLSCSYYIQLYKSPKCSWLAEWLALKSRPVTLPLRRAATG